MNRFLIAKLGSTFPELAARQGDFEDWIRARLGIPETAVSVVDARQHPELPDPAHYCGIVLTGSHAMVTDREPWSEGVARWIPEVVAREIPLLGICYGHQLLAHALGGTVGWNPKGREFGTVEIRVHDTARRDPLFAHLPARISAQACHAQSVLTLPPGATCLASSAHDPHHAFVVGRAAWGVQFHPEFDVMAMQTYLAECAELLRGEGRDPDMLRRATADTPLACRLLRRFGELCAAGRGSLSPDAA